MTDPALPASLMGEIQDLQRRLRNLETANQLLSSSIQGGTLIVLDDSGVEVARMGTLPPNIDGTPDVGLRVAGTADNLPVLRVGATTGIDAPYLNVPWRKSTDHYLCVNGSFEDAYRARIDMISSRHIRFAVTTTLDVGTTGEMRFTINGAQIGNVKTIPAGTVTGQEFRIAHGLPLNFGPYHPALQVRRTGGAGNVTIWEPTQLAGGFYTVVAGGWE